MTDQAVIESIDSGADISGSDTGASGASSAGASEAALPADTGAGVQDGGAKDTGSAAAAAGGVGADAKPAAGDAAQGEGKDKLVPLAALHEARNEVKDLRAKIAALEALPRLTPEQQKALDKLNSAEAAIDEKDPDFLEDPKGYVDSKLTKAQQALKKLDEANEQRAAQDRAQQEVTQLVSAIGAKEQAFVATTPDYFDAVVHIRTVRAQQLQMLYPQATPDQITRQITTEEVGAARQLLQQGGDPAQFAYNYAKTMGYVPKAKAAAAGDAAAAAPKTDKDAVRSMGGGGGGDSTAEAEEGNGIPEFSSALAERFGRGKKK